MTVSSLSLPNDALFGRLLSIAIKNDDKVVVDDHSTGTKFGYAQILHGIVKLRQKLRNALRDEISHGPGQFYVALLAPNGYEFIIGVFAVLACGGVVVPMREYKPYAFLSSIPFKKLMAIFSYGSTSKRSGSYTPGL